MFVEVFELNIKSVLLSAQYAFGIPENPKEKSEGLSGFPKPHPKNILYFRVSRKPFQENISCFRVSRNLDRKTFHAFGIPETNRNFEVIL